MTVKEPILHLAKRGVKQPESLKAGEIKRLSEWVVLAFRQHQREAARLVGEDFVRANRVVENTDSVFEEPFPFHRKSDAEISENVRDGIARRSEI